MILITGATGLLGSHLLFELASKGEEVFALRRATSNLDEVKKIFGYYGDPEDQLKNIHWIEADLLNYADVLESLENITHVYHCAATVSFDSRDDQRMIEENTRGTANLVNAAIEQGVKRFLHVSSTSAVGKAPEGEPTDESMIWTESKTNSAYAVSKFKSEMEVWRGMQEGLNAVIVNPGIILGPGFWERGSSSIFSTIDRGLKYYSRGVTGYIGVWDVVKAMVQLMELDTTEERFILTAENLSYKELFDRVAEALGKKKPSIEPSLALANLVRRLDWLRSRLTGQEQRLTKDKINASRSIVKYDNTKIRQTLDFEFESIEKVIREIAEIYKSDRARKE
jgi:nucleoside-diphosphate-sugar epimerase